MHFIKKVALVGSGSNDIGRAACDLLPNQFRGDGVLLRVARPVAAVDWPLARHTRLTPLGERGQVRPPGKRPELERNCHESL